MKTFSKHLKYRIENNEILICHCKELLDFKIDLKYLEFLRQINAGIEYSDSLSIEEKNLFNDLNKINGLVELKIKPLTLKNYSSAYSFLEQNLHLVRTKEFLIEKLKQYPQYFKGLYLDNELIGIIQGFPRDDYILISEIAVDQRFRNKGYASLLVKEFEKEVQEKIKVGAQDEAIPFYLSLDYKPSLYIQLEKESPVAPKYFISKQEFDNMVGYEIAVQKMDIDFLNKWKEKSISAQYLFTKMIISPLLVKAINLVDNKKALDLGFGNGLDVLYLLSKGFQVTAVEKDNDLIEKIKNLNLENINIINRDILNFDFKEKYNLINCSFVLHFIKTETRNILQKIKDSTAENGINLIITFIDKGNFTNIHDGFFKSNELKYFYSDWEALDYFEKEVKTKEVNSDGTPKKQFAAFLLAKKINNVNK